MFKKLTFLLAGAGLVILAACNTDKCKDKNCGTNGTCNIVTGNCDCTLGYEGATCTTEARTKFLGSGYNATESCGSVSSAGYTVDMTTIGNVTNFRISNFGNYGVDTNGDTQRDRGVNVDATLVSADSFTVVTSSNDASVYTITGGGKFLSAGRVRFSYSCRNIAANTTDNCSGTLQR